MRRLLVGAVALIVSGCGSACAPAPSMGCHQAVDLVFPPHARARFHRIVHRESRGSAAAQNRASSAAGCAQLLRIHAPRFRKLGYTWERDRYSAYPNIRVAHDLWVEQGWRPWALTA